MTRFPLCFRHGPYERAFVTREKIVFERKYDTYPLDVALGAPRSYWTTTDLPSEKLKRDAYAAQAGVSNPRTVRFAVWENQTWSRIGLTDGQQLEHTEGGPTDEGYSWENTTWIREGDIIRREYTSTARDCDGPLEHRQDSECHIDEAESDYHEDIETGEIIMRPNWEKVSSSRRDHYAEAAGY